MENMQEDKKYILTKSIKYFSKEVIWNFIEKHNIELNNKYDVYLIQVFDHNSYQFIEEKTFPKKPYSKVEKYWFKMLKKHIEKEMYKYIYVCSLKKYVFKKFKKKYYYCLTPNNWIPISKFKWKKYIQKHKIKYERKCEDIEKDFICARKHFSDLGIQHIKLKKCLCKKEYFIKKIFLSIGKYLSKLIEIILRA